MWKYIQHIRVSLSSPICGFESSSDPASKNCKITLWELHVPLYVNYVFILKETSNKCKCNSISLTRSHPVTSHKAQFQLGPKGLVSIANGCKNALICCFWWLGRTQQVLITTMTYDLFIKVRKRSRVSGPMILIKYSVYF